MSINQHKQNNLTFLRWVGASLVLIGHSFIFLGLPEPSFLGLALGPLGVWIFFSISGYLVAQSWERDPNVIRFLIRRILRIFPGLIICLVLSVFFLGPLVSKLAPTDYFRNPVTYNYLFENTLLYTTFYLPGVFENNRVANAVNGSLWSLPAEFSMYLLVATLGAFKIPRGLWSLILLSLMVSCYVWAIKATDMLVVYRTDLRQIIICGVYFWVGVVYQYYRIEKYFNLTNFGLAILIWVILSHWATPFYIGSWFILPFIVLAFGLTNSKSLGELTKFDYSYGIYIYAFPVQQTLAYFWPQMDIWLYLISSFLITLFFSGLSWHFIESKVLKFKPQVKSIKNNALSLHR